MEIFIDESGDFSFPDAKYDCYVLAAVVCPESVSPKLEALVNRLKLAFGVDELHATELSEEQRLAFAFGLARLDIRFVAMATDTKLDSKKTIQTFRLAQADKFKKGLDRYVTGTEQLGKTPDPEIQAFTDRAINRFGLASQVTDGEIVQTHYTLELLNEALQASLFLFIEDRWRPSFSEFRFKIDGKLKSKLSSGEKVLEDHLLPTLGSRPYQSLGVVDTWKGPPPHPFIEKYEIFDVRVGDVEADAGFDLRKIFENGLSFVDSESSAGVQAADLIAHSLRRAVMEPDNYPARLTANTLLPSAFSERGIGAQVVRLGANGQEEQNVSRFRPIARSQTNS